MTREIPAPLRAAAGLAAAAVEEARRLPSRLASLPVVAVGAALQASMRVQQRYADLVSRGDQVLAGLREPEEQPPWARFDEDETSPNGRTAEYRPADGGWAFADEEIGTLADDADEYDEYVADTATTEPAKPEPAGGIPSDAAGADPTTGPDAGVTPARSGSSGTEPPMHPARPEGRRSPGAKAVGARSTGARSTVSRPVAGRSSTPGREATGAAKTGAAKTAGAKATTGSKTTSGTRAVAARSAGTKTGGAKAAAAGAKAATARSARAAGGRKAAAAGAASPAESDPTPLPNYDRLTLAQVRARLTRLSADDLAALLEHERTHAGRPPYLTMLENRLNRTQQH